MSTDMEGECTIDVDGSIGVTNTKTSSAIVVEVPGNERKAEHWLYSGVDQPSTEVADNGGVVKPGRSRTGVRSRIFNRRSRSPNRRSGSCGHRSPSLNIRSRSCTSRDRSCGHRSRSESYLSIVSVVEEVPAMVASGSSRTRSGQKVDRRQSQWLEDRRLLGTTVVGVDGPPTTW